ncbi:hypothetical protein JQ543_29255 [Bradyrhizobium diazoefficiens]|nr:hypothetical protein [Bradyrhizobium diazoefficiens]MBR0851858.1 hypothetical protein [Bradyrhizobium diazoefficiens]
MKRKEILESYTSEWPPRRPELFDEGESFVSVDDIHRIASKSDLDRSWSEFLSWIGFSELTKCLERKAASIDQTFLKLLAESIFSIEIGLCNLVKRWSTLRKLPYPKDSSIYNAYSFVQNCIALKRTLSQRGAEQLRARVIAGLLPSGRLADLDLELNIWRSLSGAPDNISHFGVLGEPGPDFVVSSKGYDIEVEGKCISPETGMPLSYGLVSPLLRSISRRPRMRYPGQFVTIEAEVRHAHPTGHAVPAFKAQIEQTYELGQDIVTTEFTTRISFRPLAEVTAQFGSIEQNSSAVFGKYRRQYGDFGFFTGHQNECLFLNLIPLAPRKTLKKIMRTISDAGEQFSKTRPAILWLHLLGMPDTQSASDDEDMLNVIDTLLDHAFSQKRDHISIVVFSSDTKFVDRRALGQSKLIRAADGKNHKRFYANPSAKFPLTSTR